METSRVQSVAEVAVLATERGELIDLVRVSVRSKVIDDLSWPGNKVLLELPSVVEAVELNEMLPARPSGFPVSGDKLEAFGEQVEVARRRSPLLKLSAQ